MIIMETTANKAHPKLVDGTGEHLKQFEQPGKEMEEEEEGFAYAIQLVTSTVLSMAMQTVTELGVFDIKARAGSGAMLSAKDIATQLCSKNPEASNILDRVLRVLASYSVLHCSVVEDDNQKLGSFKRLYSLAPVAKYFACNDDGVSLGPLLSITRTRFTLIVGNQFLSPHYTSKLLKKVDSDGFSLPLIF